ncbi:MAG: tetratricopeptide repeat protein [Alphaproteobacteria bacterium]|nr:tetratricopeptide repeat protein [Alphaproteobacteria bacterium]
MAISQGESFRRARELYDARRSPQTTREMRQLLTETRHETALIHSITLVCDYINHWNDATLREVNEAANLVNQVLKANPTYFLAHYAKGFIHRARNQHRAAYRAFGEALRLQPEFARAYAQQGEELVYLGRPAEGIKLVEEALRRRPESVARGMFHWIIGRAQFFMGNDAEAIKPLSLSIEEWPNLWYNRCYLIAAYAHLGDTTAATAALIDLNNVDGLAGHTLTQVLEHEIRVPASHAVVTRGRERFHDGLLLAGMPR